VARDDIREHLHPGGETAAAALGRAEKTYKQTHTPRGGDEDGEQTILGPTRPEDEHIHFEFFTRISVEDWHHRCDKMDHIPRAAVTHEEKSQLAFMAVRPRAAGSKTPPNGTTLDVEELGMVRVVMDIDLEGCEYTILVRSDMDGHGLGRLFTDKPIKYCKARSVKMMNCHALTDNLYQAMLSFA